MDVLLSDPAVTELTSAYDYYKKIDSDLALRFTHEVSKSIDWIKTNYTIPRLRGNYRRFNLIKFPYYIAYTIEDKVILVHAFAHQRRNPEYWCDR